MKKISILLLFIMIAPLASGCKITKGIDQYTREKMRPITINYWRVFDEADDFSSLIAAYQATHPNIKINYRRFRYNEYEKALIEAFAADRGPDIFSIHNSWVRSYQHRGLLTPLPEQVTMIYPVLKKGLRDEYQYIKKTTRSITPDQLKSVFADSVYGDVVIPFQEPETNRVGDRIWGLPLAMDTLALYYNRDLFNNAGIAAPSEYWNRKFQQDVKKMTKQNNRGEIIQSGVALGGSSKIDRSADILAALMMQNGTQMMAGQQVTFHSRPPSSGDRSYLPGLEALRFYTDFANPAKEVYSWNSTLPNSLELFTQGKLAMMFGYAYHLPQINNLSPKLNFAIAEFPQIEGNPQTINFANYWVETVSKKTKISEEAWDFLQFIAKKENIKEYLDKTGKPTALRSLIEDQRDDPRIGIFASQVFTAKSWYQGYDAMAMETIMREMIDEANTGLADLANTINLAARKVQQTAEKKNYE